MASVCAGAGGSPGVVTAAGAAVLAVAGTLEGSGAPLLECSYRSSNREVTASSLRDIRSVISKCQIAYALPFQNRRYINI